MHIAGLFISDVHFVATTHVSLVLWEGLGLI